jgi:transcriptional regulator with XRE-family HTH domain
MSVASDVVTTRADIPPLTLGWRLKMALAHAGMSQGQMAKELGYSRNSLGDWFNGSRVPRRVFLLEWARQTGVDAEWLLTGVAGTP